MNMDVGREIPHKFSDEVANWIGCQANPMTRAGCGPASSAVGHIGIADALINRTPYHRRIVEHPFAVVALRPDHLIEAMSKTAFVRSIRHAVIARVLMREPRNKKRADKLMRHVLSE